MEGARRSGRSSRPAHPQPHLAQQHQHQLQQHQQQQLQQQPLAAGSRHVRSPQRAGAAPPPTTRLQGERSAAAAGGAWAAGGGGGGPRSLFLRRCEHGFGFGFTLRHFIVYPPESYAVLQGDRRLGLRHGLSPDDPMDTIFVKSVREHSPAFEAGLSTGDRIIGVNGRSVLGHSYQRVVQWIQQSGACLQLLVVPREDDLVQLYFGETAHNPETNQRPRLRSPDTLDRRTVAMLQQQQQQQQQAAGAAAAAAAARLAQAGSRGSLPAPVTASASLDSWSDPRVLSPASGPGPSPGPLAAAPNDRAWLRPQTRRSSEGAGPARRDGLYLYQDGAAAAAAAERALWAGAGAGAFRPLGGAPEPPPAPACADQPPLATSSRSLQAFFYPHAAAGCRLSLDAAASRRASTASLPTAGANPGAGPGQGPAAPAPPPAAPASSASDAGSKDSLLSFESAASTASTLTGGRDGCSSDDSLIISRIRKSFEQKEEFLRRPNQPIAWNLPERPAPAGGAVIAREFYARPQKLQRPVWPPPAPAPGGHSTASSASPSPTPPPRRPRHASPQRAASAGAAPGARPGTAPGPGARPTHQSLRRVKSDIDSERDSSPPAPPPPAPAPASPRSPALFERAASEPCEDLGRRSNFICGGPVTNVPPPAIGKATLTYGHSLDSAQFRPITPVPASPAGRSPGPCSGGGKAAFISTLSRIHENLPTAAPAPSHPYDDYYGAESGVRSSSSFPNSPGGDVIYTRAMSSPMDDGRSGISSSRYPAHPSLQLVSKRTQQFETGAVGEEEGPPDRTSLYRSELARLSAKKSAPNVAVRRHEFETRAGGSSSGLRESRRPARESRSLESAANGDIKLKDPENSQASSGAGGRRVSGNWMIPVGGRLLHCEPPHDFKQLAAISETEPSTTDSINHHPPPSAREETSVKLRARSNSAESWSATGSSRQGRGAPDHSLPGNEPQRHKAVRQDSYLAAVRTPLGSTDLGNNRLKRQAALLLDEDEELVAPMTPTPIPVPSSMSSPVSTSTSNPAPPCVMVRNASPPVARPTHLPILNPLCPAEPSSQAMDFAATGMEQLLEDSLTVPGSSSVPKIHSSDGQASPSTAVLRRQKNQQTSLTDEERIGRRVSYLKATWGDRMHVDSDFDLSDGETPLVQHRSTRKWRPPLFPEDIQRLKRIFEEMSSGSSGAPRPPVRQTACSDLSGDRTDSPGPPPPPAPEDAAEAERDRLGACAVDACALAPAREGWLHCKTTLIDGKRAADRSWKPVWASLRGYTLVLHRERRDAPGAGAAPAASNAAAAADQTPLSGHGDGGAGDVDGEQLDTRTCRVDVAGDYTKKKHVLRLSTLSGSEVLLQADTADDMALWLSAVQQRAHEYAGAGAGRKGELPPAPLSAPLHGVGGGGGAAGARLSPLPAHKGIRKFTSFRNRSPTGQSPVNKTRKPSQTEQLPSPKSKTWKGRVAKQLRKIQHGAGSPSSPTAPHPEGCTIGVPLELCPPSNFSAFVPLLVELCTSVVDSRGLDIIGIYRVPGNTAAVTALTESVNKGFEATSLQDPRWNDVNVISSLLKLFFRKLPNALLTSELYPLFIEADKIEDANERILTIKKLVHDLPEHHFETLRYLLFHLKKVVEHCESNKMEARNLAIVFGPTLVRTSDDNMVTMVTDMSHQCRIVESLISHVDWFFSDEEDTPCNFPFNNSQDVQELEASSTNHNILLSNIQKVEGMKADSANRDMRPKDIVSSIISAANRKMQKAKSRKGNTLMSSSTQEDSHEALTEPLENETKQMQDSKGKLREPEPLAPVATAESDESLHQPTSAVASSIRESVLLSGSIVKSLHSGCEDGSTGESSSPDEVNEQMSNVPSGTHSIRRYVAGVPLAGDEAATIRTYTGLSATTQERIRRFELETKAMLQRDQYRHRQEQERREAEKQRIEHEWQQAKRDMENEDMLDKLADNPADLSRKRDLGSRAPGTVKPSGGTAQLLLPTQAESQGAVGPPSPAAAHLARTLQQYQQHHAESLQTHDTGSGTDENDGNLSFTHTRKVGSTHFFPSSPGPNTSQPTALSCMAAVSTLVDAGYPPTAKSVARSVELAAARSAQSSSKDITNSPGNSGQSKPDSTVCAVKSSPPQEGATSTLEGKETILLNTSSQLKRLKTGNEQGLTPSHTLGSLRSGSLDSLQEAYTSDTATRPQSDISDDGGDLLASLTSTFDRKLKSLLTTSVSDATSPDFAEVTLEREPLLHNEVPPAQDPLQKTSPVTEGTEVLELNVTVAEQPTTITSVLFSGRDCEQSLPKDKESDDSPPEGVATQCSSGVKRSSPPLTQAASFPAPRRMAPLERQSRVEQHLDAIDNKLKELQNCQSEEREDLQKKIKDCVSKNEKVKEERSLEDKETASSKLKRSESLGKTEKFESMMSTRLKRSESLTKAEREDMGFSNSRLKRSESLTKAEKVSNSSTKLRRSESLTKAERSESPSNLKLKRSDSLTKTEKTESNNSKRKQDLLLSSGMGRGSNRGCNKEKENMAITKLKRKNGMPERSIKRRHTVGGTKDFDKLNWLDNRRQHQLEENEALVASAHVSNKERQCLRTSSPDLSSSRLGNTILGHERFLIEIRMLSRGGGVMSELRHNISHNPSSGIGRPHSLPDPNLASRVFKVPLESHV